jgi:hypothetical protein
VALSWVALSWAALSWAALSWAALTWAALGWAALSWARTLSWAPLSWVTMGWATLSWAALSLATLSHSPCTPLFRSKGGWGSSRDLNQLRGRFGQIANFLFGICFRPVIGKKRSIWGTFSADLLLCCQIRTHDMHHEHFSDNIMAMLVDNGGA